VNWEGADAEAAALARLLALDPDLKARFRALFDRLSMKPVVEAIAIMARMRAQTVARATLAEEAWSRKAVGRFFWAWRRRVGRRGLGWGGGVGSFRLCSYEWSIARGPVLIELPINTS
jgi:hypothetical protein